MLAEVVEGLALVTAELVLAGHIHRWDCRVDGGAYHVEDDGPIEDRSSGRVLVTKEPHNNRQYDSLLVEFHGLKLAQHVAVEVVQHGRVAQAATQLSNNDHTDPGDRRGVRMGTWTRQTPHS